MAFKRKRVTKAPGAMKRRRIVRKRTTSLNTLKTSRFVIKQDIPGNDTTPGGTYAWAFSLNEVPGYTEYTTLFDQYKINRIQYRFVLKRNPDFANVNKGFMTRIMTVIDHDDTTLPASFAELQQYPKANEIWLNDNRPVTRWRSLKPSTLNYTYNGVVANAYTVKYNQWLDTGFTNTYHYGLKLAYDQLYAGCSVFVECRYHMEFKDPK